jgi:hypothetical protein
MRRRGGKHTLGQVLESRTCTATAPPEAFADAPEATRTADTEGEVVRLEAERGEHVMKGHVLTDLPRGAHVMENDPFLSVERRALHIMKGPDVATPGLSTFSSETTRSADDIISDLASAAEVSVARPVRRAAERRTRQSRPMRHGAPNSASRRWRLVPVAGAAGALVVGLGGGAAFAFFSGGPGTGEVATGSPVTLDAVATTGPADLLPGDDGAVSFTVDNPNGFGATFAQVAPGATVVSDNTGLCPSTDVSIAQTLPYAFSPAIAVSAGSTSGRQSIPGLVELAANAPGTCQGVTFTVTFKLSGQSS